MRENGLGYFNECLSGISFKRIKFDGNDFLVDFKKIFSKIQRDMDNHHYVFKMKIDQNDSRLIVLKVYFAERGFFSLSSPLDFWHLKITYKVEEKELSYFLAKDKEYSFGSKVDLKFKYMLNFISYLNRFLYENTTIQKDYAAFTLATIINNDIAKEFPTDGENFFYSDEEEGRFYFFRTEELKNYFEKQKELMDKGFLFLKENKPTLFEDVFSLKKKDFWSWEMRVGKVIYSIQLTENLILNIEYFIQFSKEKYIFESYSNTNESNIETFLQDFLDSSRLTNLIHNE